MRGRERRRRLEGGQELIITSMVDTFTLLLTFLLNFVSPSTSTAADLLLPDSTAVTAVGTGVVLSVSDRQVQVGGRTVLSLESAADGPAVPRSALGADGTVTALHDALVAALQAQPPATGTAADAQRSALLVECDRSLPYALVSELLASARLAGFDHFRLVVNGSGG